jgi:hypothetical protein
MLENEGQQILTLCGQESRDCWQKHEAWIHSEKCRNKLSKSFRRLSPQEVHSTLRHERERQLARDPLQRSEQALGIPKTLSAEAMREPNQRRGAFFGTPVPRELAESALECHHVTRGEIFAQARSVERPACL